MEDERRYSLGTGTERGSLPRSIYPAYMEPDFPSLASHTPFYSSAVRRPSQDYLDRDIESFRHRSYGLDNVSGLAARSESGISGVKTGVDIRSYLSSYEDPNLLNQRPDVSRLINPGIPDPLYEQTSSLQRDDGHISEILYERKSSLQRDGDPSSSVNESNTLFVDGLPGDCTRREVGHLFRPFIGFKDVRVVHKEPRREGAQGSNSLASLSQKRYNLKAKDDPYHSPTLLYTPPSLTLRLETRQWFCALWSLTTQLVLVLQWMHSKDTSLIIRKRTPLL